MNCVHCEIKVGQNKHSGTLKIKNMLKENGFNGKITSTDELNKEESLGLYHRVRDRKCWTSFAADFNERITTDPVFEISIIINAQ